VRQITRPPQVEVLLLAALIVAASSGAFYPIALPSAYLATFR
jgi:hypothetical protein